MKYFSMSKCVITGMFMSAIVMSSCEQQQEALDPSVSQLVEKIETTYSGGEKIETLGAQEKQGKPSSINREALEEKVRQETTKAFETYVKRFKGSVTLFDGYDVGVIPASRSCPSWSEFINFKMDNEDDSNASTSSGFPGAFVFDSHGNSHLGFCRIDGRLFGGSAYTVLALGPYKPAAFESLSQAYIDNEDDGNQNDHSGDIGPNASTKNTTLYFYTNTDWSAGGYPTGFPYFVLKGDQPTNMSFTNTHMSDDENDSNKSNLQNWGSGPNAVYTSPDGFYKQIQGVGMYRAHLTLTKTYFQMQQVVY